MLMPFAVTHGKKLPHNHKEPERCVDLGYGAPGSVLLLFPVIFFGALGWIMSPRNRNDGFINGAAVGLAVDVLWYVTVKYQVSQLRKDQ